jgi:hypothetical protein
MDAIGEPIPVTVAMEQAFRRCGFFDRERSWIVSANPLVGPMKDTNG